MKPKYYLTTPLYYVNAKPHIGHAYTTVAADVLARFKRLRGYDVYFLTGTDEHGQKVQQAATKQGLTPQAFTDQLSGEFRELWKVLNIQYDDFIRTTEDRHKKAVKHIWELLQKSEWISQKTYEGWYSTIAESFLSSKDLEEEMKDGVALDKKPHLEHLREENYFFDISKFQKWLIDYLRSHPDSVQPQTRLNETLGFLENNQLADLCISRPKARLAWGIDVPFSPNHVTYVWFDALINYISAIGYPDRMEQFKKYWPCDVHLIGKDILRPHTVYWPMMLHALGIEPPKMVFAHGWWMVDKAKMSKSLGNVVDPHDVVRDYGVDPFRYFMMREVPFGHDGVYSDAAMLLRYNVDLANDLGNLIHRTLSMLEKYYDGIVPSDNSLSINNELRTLVESLPNRMEDALNAIQFSDALSMIWEVIGRANKFIEVKAPWALKKQNKDAELREVMQTLFETMRVITQSVYPFMPASAMNIWKQLGLPDADLTSPEAYRKSWGYCQAPIRIQKGQPVFPRKETE